MRTRLTALLAVFLLCLAGCSEPYMETPAPPPESAPTQTEALPQPPAESTNEPNGTVLTVLRPDLMIYPEPGYDFAGTGILLDPGEYVITEETADYEGIRWGRLVSGDGWIDLDEAAEEAHVLLTMESANDRTIDGREYHEHALSDSEYAMKLLLCAWEPLTGIRVTAMDFDENGLFPAGELFSLPELTPQKPLVLTVAFPGDLTTYGILYTDAAGAEHTCILYQSGRSGDIILQEKE